VTMGSISETEAAMAGFTGGTSEAMLEYSSASTTDIDAYGAPSIVSMLTAPGGYC